MTNESKYLISSINSNVKKEILKKLNSINYDDKVSDIFIRDAIHYLEEMEEENLKVVQFTDEYDCYFCRRR